jgi:hypothetical protein
MRTETVLLLVFTLLMAGAFGIPGIFAIVRYFIVKGRYNIDPKWTNVEGIVNAARLERLEEAAAYGGHDIFYKPVLEYSYIVDGYTFTTMQLDFGSQRLSLSKAQDILNRYPEGSKITVFFNPVSASEATAKVTNSAANIWLIAGIVLTLCGLCVACSGTALLIRVLTLD